ncbi:hypothetical protein CL634_07175 [bacterium]|nr:hypothetical protein [bacterium]|tara:strand:+ start:534 stop:809 length:276 start_codon:yes stop_codon:yes gene_type:complete
MARRKKKKTAPVDRGLLEYKEYKLDETIWFPVKFEARIHQGVIMHFYPNDKIEPALQVRDDSHGGYRVIPVRYAFKDAKAAKIFRKEEFAK